MNILIKKIIYIHVKNVKLVCDDVSTENLNKYYETLDKKVPKFHIINSKNLIQDFSQFYTL